MNKARRLGSFLLAALLLSSTAHASSKSPNDPTSTTFEPLGFLRGIAPLTPTYSVLGEVSRTSEAIGPEKALGTYLLGVYAQPSDALRFGLFYRRSVGELYSEDWSNSGSGWGWTSNRGRAENEWIADVSPRTLGSLFGREDSVLEAKVRLVQSDLYDHRTLVVRPGVLHPILRDGAPWMTVNSAVEVDLPLNGADRALNQFWVYFGGTVRVATAVDFALNLAFARRFWDATPDFRSRTGESFTVAHSSFTAGFGLIFRISE